MGIFNVDEGAKTGVLLNKDSRLVISEAPHVTKKGNTTRALMRNVLIALAPSAVAAFYFFGYMVLVNLFACVVFCAGFELLYGMILERDFSLNALKKSTIWDLSCVVTAFILALNFPAKMNLFNSSNEVVIFLSTMLANLLGSLFAIVISKMMFGGIGRNFANPAVVGRVFLIICFTQAMITATNADGWGLSTVTGATWLTERKELTPAVLLDMFLGNRPSAAVGETSALAILIGFVYLLVTKTIDFKIPLFVVLSVVVSVLLLEGWDVESNQLIYYVLGHLLSGGILFAAVFMATDYATSPNTTLGCLIFSIGIGFFTVLIRLKSDVYFEGVSFAILIMNLLVPILDKYIIPRPFGVKRRQ